MTRATVICFAGYTVATTLITWAMSATPTELLFSYLGAIPIGYYCAVCDKRETKP